ncbi:MAG: hypothetical protein ACOYMZ_02010 [Minisyncoccia bacterium]
MLSKLRILFWLGIITLCISFIGIPDSWKMTSALVIGVALIALAVTLRKEYRLLRLKLKEYGQ